ncbi:capsular polysaccharide synthesis protein [Salinibacter ruber]|uniref:capsular polysaccharide synthesis protein n=1 Tax=Salinibacter ruber TaxID=146919 RepID=UPI0024502566|nr:hypothetical protein [Salinibacter ruber]
MAIPRTIWTIWLQGRENAPPLVRHCLNSWEEMNPNWNFRCLSREELLDQVNLDSLTDGVVSQMSKNHIADLARINLLERHGGVWTDATCLCMTPLDDWIHEHAGSGFFAFSNPRPDRLISSWFLASDTDCELTSQYCSVVNSYCAANNFVGPEGFAARLIAKVAHRFVGNDPWRSALYVSPLFARYVGCTPYFFFHYSFAYTLLASRAARKVWSETPKVSSNLSMGDGPHALQHHGMFETISDALAKRISTRKDPLYKLSWKKSAEQDSAFSETDSRLAVKFAMQEAGVEAGTK